MPIIINYSVHCNSNLGLICSVEKNCLVKRVQNLCMSAQANVTSPFVTKWVQNMQGSKSFVTISVAQFLRGYLWKSPSWAHHSIIVCNYQLCYQAGFGTSSDILWKYFLAIWTMEPTVYHQKWQFFWASSQNRNLGMLFCVNQTWFIFSVGTSSISSD